MTMLLRRTNMGKWSSHPSSERIPSFAGYPILEAPKWLSLSFQPGDLGPREMKPSSDPQAGDCDHASLGTPATPFRWLASFQVHLAPIRVALPTFFCSETRPDLARRTPPRQRKKPGEMLNVRHMRGVPQSEDVLSIWLEDVILRKATTCGCLQ